MNNCESIKSPSKGFWLAAFLFSKVALSRVLSLVIASTIVSCDNGLGPRRKITGVYLLQQFTENELFYLHKKNAENSPAGYVEGTVVTAGWNSTYLAMEMQSIYLIDGVREPNFWVVIDLTTDQVTTDLTEKEFEDLNLELKLLPVEEIWRKL